MLYPLKISSTSSSHILNRKSITTLIYGGYGFQGLTGLINQYALVQNRT